MRGFYLRHQLSNWPRYPRHCVWSMQCTVRTMTSASATLPAKVMSLTTLRSARAGRSPRVRTRTVPPSTGCIYVTRA